MKNLMQSVMSKSECPVRNSVPAWARRITPDLEFNARAVRARAGLLNVFISAAMVLMLVNPESSLIPSILSLLTIDLSVSVIAGLTPYSPLGAVATLLTRWYEPQWTPHLPKRFAWSMGTTLAATCLIIHLAGAPVVWSCSVLGIFFVLTWMDAVLGFCMGCWIYSKLFGCHSCHVG